MGRTKKKLADDSVKVRYKALVDGRKSVYLDFCAGGKRTYDFLKLYLLPEKDPEAVRKNKATMKKVGELQRERTLQLMGIESRSTTVSQKSTLKCFCPNGWTNILASRKGSESGILP